MTDVEQQSDRCRTAIRVLFLLLVTLINLKIESLASLFIISILIFDWVIKYTVSGCD